MNPAFIDAPLVVRVLDVGQGDATMIENGGSIILIDGGPDPEVFGRHLDRLRLNGDTIDALLITHAHYDHYNGLAELFKSSRRITVRQVFESRDDSPNITLLRLRDSILARMDRGELEYHDTDDPCGGGSSVCTVMMRGGAKFHILRPMPAGDSPNNRSTPAKLVSADSVSLTMWFAGDAEQSAIRWFESAGYARNPGMRVDILKGNHHGSCDGISARYLDLLRPALVTFSLAGANEYGYVHNQTQELLRSRGIPWHRTDQNGDISITTPSEWGHGYSVKIQRGGTAERGAVDRKANPMGCQ